MGAQEVLWLALAVPKMLLLMPLHLVEEVVLVGEPFHVHP